MYVCMHARGKTFPKSSFIRSSCSRLSLFSALQSQGNVRMQNEVHTPSRGGVKELNEPIYGLETLLNTFETFFCDKTVHVLIKLFLHKQKRSESEKLSSEFKNAGSTSYFWNTAYCSSVSPRSFCSFADCILVQCYVNAMR